MVGAKRFLLPRQRSPIHLLRSGVVPLLIERAPQIVEAAQRMRMVRSKRFLPPRQRTPKHLFLPGVVPFVTEQNPKSVDTAQRIRMVRAEDPLTLLPNPPLKVQTMLDTQIMLGRPGIKCQQGRPCISRQQLQLRPLGDQHLHSPAPQLDFHSTPIAFRLRQQLTAVKFKEALHQLSPLLLEIVAAPPAAMEGVLHQPMEAPVTSAALDRLQIGGTAPQVSAETVLGIRNQVMQGEPIEQVLIEHLRQGKNHQRPEFPRIQVAKEPALQLRRGIAEVRLPARAAGAVHKFDGKVQIEGINDAIPTLRLIRCIQDPVLVSLNRPCQIGLAPG